MTFLPIVERELRVAARRKGTYLTRVGVGMGAMVLGGIAALVAVFNPTVRFGTVFFQTLSGLAMVYCLGAGRFLTADCLSGEKREETMGLLFLTDLKGYDVVLGKMAATSLNGLYGLLAVLPVLALTLLTGGITNGEFWRVVLVLLDTFLFSLAVGILASALTREFRSAMALNFYLLLALVGLLPALAGLLLFFHPASAPARDLFLPCPVYTLVLAFDAPYKKEAAQFWTSAALIQAMAWLLLALACRIAPQSWQAKPAAQAKKMPPKEEAFRSRRSLAFRKHLLDQNAYYWLAARPWWKAHIVWVVIGVAVFWLVSMILSIGWVDEAICLVVAFTMNGAFKLWITIEAGQSLAEDMKSGAFELLLATPLTARDMVRGQWLALRRQFLKPLVVLAGLELYFMMTLMAAPAHNRSFSSDFFLRLWLAVILLLAADAVTLSVVAMSAALTEKNHTMASLKTVRVVLLGPWVFWAVVAAVALAWAYLFPDTGPVRQNFLLGSWFGIGLGWDLLSGWRAWRRLTGNFRELALRRFEIATPKKSLRARSMEMSRAFRDHVWRHPGRRKWAAGLAALLVISMALKVWDSNRSHDPPPEVVLTGAGEATALQAVEAGNGVFLILPDGSLWRWGQTEGTNRAILPELVGTNRDWSMISVNGRQRLGVRRDGTLWEWQTNGAPVQMGPDKDWIEATGGLAYRAARKKDGTLWAWGDFVINRPSLPLSSPVWIPAPPATNHAWKIVQSQRGGALVINNQGSRGGFRGGYNLAVDADGSLWVWGTINLLAGNQVWGNGTARPTNWVNVYLDPIQVCRETNWVGFNLGMPQNDRGDLWSLFAAPPNPAASINSIGNIFRSQTPVQLGTNQDWVALDSRINTFLALRSDGTLWGWGDSVANIGGSFMQVLTAQPMQLCAESDWIGFDHTFGPLAVKNKAGELWIPMSSPVGMTPPGTSVARPKVAGSMFNMLGTTARPNAATSINLTGSLFARPSSTNQPEQAGQPFQPFLTRYEVHTNGTLWFSTIVHDTPEAPGLMGKPQQAGQRTDWVAVTGAGHAFFGLTADGTLWTWGLNYGVEPRVEARTRIDLAKIRAEAAMGIGSANQRASWISPTYPVEEKPRALMKLVPEKGK